jgi:hypothetical protein
MVKPKIASKKLRELDNHRDDLKDNSKICPVVIPNLSIRAMLVTLIV